MPKGWRQITRNFLHLKKQQGAPLRMYLLHLQEITCTFVYNREPHPCWVPICNGLKVMLTPVIKTAIYNASPNFHLHKIFHNFLLTIGIAIISNSASCGTFDHCDVENNFLPLLSYDEWELVIHINVVYQRSVTIGLAHQILHRHDLAGQSNITTATLRIKNKNQSHNCPL